MFFFFVNSSKSKRINNMNKILQLELSYIIKTENYYPFLILRKKKRRENFLFRSPILNGRIFKINLSNTEIKQH